jgi:rare lipoprotein A
MMHMKYLLIALIIITTGVSTVGTASYYSNKFHGRKTASGQVYNKNKFTAASNKFELGDSVKVINLSNGKEINVLINDRMANNGRVIDLSYAAADSLDFIRQGLTRVKIELL